MFKKLLGSSAVLMISAGLLFYWSYSDAVFSVVTSEKVVALTYDDGPNPPYTEALLATLAAQNIKATFFLKGANAEAYPASVAAIADAGHELANHSYFHRSLMLSTPSAALAEIGSTAALLEHYAGFNPNLFRPPYGSQGPGLKRALGQLNMVSILANSNGADWEQTDASVIAEMVLSTLKPGSIILLHDGHGDVDSPSAQDSREPTVEATEIVIDALRVKGYRFVTVGELLAMGA